MPCRIELRNIQSARARSDNTGERVIYLDVTFKMDDTGERQPTYQKVALMFLNTPDNAVRAARLAQAFNDILQDP